VELVLTQDGAATEVSHCCAALMSNCNLHGWLPDINSGGLEAAAMSCSWRHEHTFGKNREDTILGLPYQWGKV
jgi:hypothetical protein